MLCWKPIGSFCKTVLVTRIPTAHLFLIEKGRAWRHSNAIYGLAIKALEKFLGQGVWKWWRKGYAGFGGDIFRFSAMGRKVEGFVPPPLIGAQANSTGDIITSSWMAWSFAIVSVNCYYKPIEPSRRTTRHQLTLPRRIPCPAGKGMTRRARGDERSLCYRFRQSDTGTDVQVRPETGTGHSVGLKPLW